MIYYIEVAMGIRKTTFCHDFTEEGVEPTREDVLKIISDENIDYSDELGSFQYCHMPGLDVIKKKTDILYSKDTPELIGHLKSEIMEKDRVIVELKTEILAISQRTAFLESFLDNVKAMKGIREN